MLQHAKKQTKHREQVIANIKSSAEIVFAEHGYSGASFGKIAAQAGIPKSNVVYYFSNKETLYRYVVEDIFNVWRQAADSIHVDNDPIQALGDYIDTKIDLAKQRPYGSKVWANEIIQGAPIVQDYLENELRSWTEDREKVIQTWIDRGQIKPVSPKHLLYLIWSGTQHYADFQHQIETLNSGKPFADSDWESAKKELRQIVLGGLAK